jgi:hypothetical protein
MKYIFQKIDRFLLSRHKEMINKQILVLKFVYCFMLVEKNRIQFET